ncbi:general secretion pathway protein F, partial [mine drainage metagenome]
MALRGTILNALVYPAFLLVGVLGALILLLTYVVPSFVPIFAGMGVPLPWITVGVLALGQFLQQWGWAVLLGLVALGVFAAQRLKDPAARLALDRR